MLCALTISAWRHGAKKQALGRGGTARVRHKGPTLSACGRIGRRHRGNRHFIPLASSDALSLVTRHVTSTLHCPYVPTTLPLCPSLPPLSLSVASLCVPSSTLRCRLFPVTPTREHLTRRFDDTHAKGVVVSFGLGLSGRAPLRVYSFGTAGHNRPRAIAKRRSEGPGWTRCQNAFPNFCPRRMVRTGDVQCSAMPDVCAAATPSFWPKGLGRRARNRRVSRPPSIGPSRAH